MMYDGNYSLDSFNYPGPMERDRMVESGEKINTAAVA